MALKNEVLMLVEDGLPDPPGLLISCSLQVRPLSVAVLVNASVLCQSSTQPTAVRGLKAARSSCAKWPREESFPVAEAKVDVKRRRRHPARQETPAAAFA